MTTKLAKVKAAIPSPLGLRKFIIALVVIAAACVLQWLGHLDPDGYQLTKIVIWVTGLYMSGNVGGKLAEKVSINLGPKE